MSIFIDFFSTRKKNQRDIQSRAFYLVLVFSILADAWYERPGGRARNSQNYPDLAIAGLMINVYMLGQQNRR